MLNTLFQFDVWLVIIGFVILLRQLQVVLAAEQGRRQDLVRKLYKANTDFHVSVLIPYLKGQSFESILSLLTALDQQDYPASKVSIHIVTTYQWADKLKAQGLRPNVKVWTYPARKAHVGEALSWLIERCLAAPGSGLFVFLKPDDIVKPDFFQNVVARSFENSVVQGYVALKKMPETWMGQVAALSNRLLNRVWNAGRYHLGLSCRLMDSGWIVHREILEMLPYRRGLDLDNLEYTIRLNLENFRVIWAPNVVIYTDEPRDFLAFISECLGSFFNRLQLFLRYGYALLSRALVRLDWGAFEQLLSIIKPPHFLLGSLLCYFAVTAALGKALVPGKALTWGLLAGVFVITQLLSLFVARSRKEEYLTFLVWTPMVYLLGVLALPVALIHDLISLWQGMQALQAQRTYRRIHTNRLNEALEEPRPLVQIADSSRSGVENQLLQEHYASLIQEVLDKNAASQSGAPVVARYATQERRATSALSLLPIDAETLTPGHEQIKTIPISNGVKEVNCVLKTITSTTPVGEEVYQMTLQYKTVAFSTAPYRLVDQAYYELHAKLKSRGFTMMTCGSCGNFYNPTADAPGALKNAGVCLFGKKGKELNLTTDSVTVLSQACPYHCPVEEREKIVRQWRESLTMATR